MSRLAILFLSHFLTCQGLIRHTVDLSGFDNNGLYQGSFQPQVENGVEENPLWVLDMNTEDLDSLKLRLGTEEDENAFEFAVGGTIRAIERSQRFQRLIPKLRVKKDDPLKTTTDESEYESNATKEENEILKRDIIRTVNKFVLTSMDLGDFVDANMGPSLSLNFKGPYTSVTVKQGSKQWHYFLRPPSPLPAWFYSPHNGMEVEIPAGIRNSFYKSLLRMLQMFLGHPL